MEKRMKFLGIPLEYDFWSEFEFIQLKQNMRQKDDPQFAEMLDRIRYGVPTIDDNNALKQRVIPRLPNLDHYTAYIDGSLIMSEKTDLVKIFILT